MEIAYWPTAWTERFPSETDRVYLGHETSIDKIPVLKDIMKVLRRLMDENRRMTFVTPSFLAENDLSYISRLIQAMAELIGYCEIVCNDWGLLHWLLECRMAQPIIGRQLVGQATDPRLAAFDLPERQLPHERSVRHADGMMVRLRYRRPKEALMTHLRSCAIAIPEVLSFFHRSGVRRLEISNVLQGIEMAIEPEWNVTLHLPEVPVAVARHRWRDSGSQWLHPTFPVALHHRDNMICYHNDGKPPQLDSLRIDRLVYRS